MNPTKNIILAATLSVLSVAHIGATQAETVKSLQGVSFHAPSMDAVAYFLGETRTCKLVLTMTDGNAQPTRFEAAISGGESTSYKITEGKSLEFACQSDAQAMTWWRRSPPIESHANSSACAKRRSPAGAIRAGLFTD
jgi:hypothetical protein